MPRVSFAVAPCQNLVKTVDDVRLGQIARFFQIVKQMVALGVNIGRDVMRDLAGCVAQPDALIECRRSDPDRSAAAVYFVAAPKADVLALARIGADGLLERQVFLASKEIQTA